MNNERIHELLDWAKGTKEGYEHAKELNPTLYTGNNKIYEILQFLLEEEIKRKQKEKIGGHEEERERKDRWIGTQMPYRYPYFHISSVRPEIIFSTAGGINDDVQHKAVQIPEKYHEEWKEIYNPSNETQDTKE